MLASFALVAFATLQPTIPPPAPAPVAAPRPDAPTLYVIRYRPGPSYRQGVPLLQQDLREHGRYMQDLVRAGVILLAGPSMSDNGGLVLLRAVGIDAARAVMAADPAVRSGLFVGDVSDWRPFFDPGGRFHALQPLPSSTNP